MPQNVLTPRLLVAENQENLFVRLTPDILSILVALASSEVLDGKRGADPNDWIFVPEMSTTFLPLEIKLGNSLLYATYNGGVLHGSTGKQNDKLLSDSFPYMQTYDESVLIIVTTTENTMWKYTNCCLPSEVYVCMKGRSSYVKTNV